MKYQRQKPLAHLLLIIGFMFGLVTGDWILSNEKVADVLSTNMSRYQTGENVKALVKDIFNDNITMDETLTDEILIKSFDYNGQKSFYFSKYWNKRYEEKLTMTDILKAAIARPNLI